MLLFLIRHAMTPLTGVKLAGWSSVPLSDEGVLQAKAMAERFTSIPLDALYSSPVERAVQTAKPLAAVKKMRLKIRPGFGEVRYGDWEGRPLKQLAKTQHWRDVIAHPSEGRFPGGEALRETSARVVAAAAEVAAGHPKGMAAIVTHADVIKMLLAHYAGIHLDLYARLAVGPASVSAVWVGDGAPRILKVNDNGSLDELVPRKK
ncbi:MAG TPA: histidine phosphatase family protein [Actinomycetota bacterium]|nr:histidine phosphatase family protein [Actinomycetota bacterium]